MNTSAVLIFVFSPDVAWRQALAVGGGAIIGGQIGVYAFRRVNEQLLRLCITALGLALTIGLFLRAHSA
jgi:uncharacterized membrane protein YfcA